MLITLIKGIIIGIVISAPLGPVGVLCLRETIHGGKNEGLLTGVGATLSDILYGFVVYLGVGLVLDFVVQYDSILRLIGGVIIVAFSLLLYRKSKQEIKHNPTKRLSKLHGTRKVLTAFLVTISNPFIMLLMLPLYTRFQFVQETSNPILELFIALLGLGLGCMIWWYILTSFVLLLISRTGHAGIRIISRTIAIILASIGIIGIGTGAASLITGEASSERLLEISKHSNTD